MWQKNDWDAASVWKVAAVHILETTVAPEMDYSLLYCMVDLVICLPDGCESALSKLLFFYNTEDKSRLSRSAQELFWTDKRENEARNHLDTD